MYLLFLDSRLPRFSGRGERTSLPFSRRLRARACLCEYEGREGLVSNLDQLRECGRASPSPRGGMDAAAAVVAVAAAAVVIGCKLALPCPAELTRIGFACLLFRQKEVLSLVQL